MQEFISTKPEKRYPVFEPLAESIARVIENVGQRTGKPEHPTGIKVLDAGIFGLHSSQLTILAARPSIGKTSFACQMAMNLARCGREVAFISLEMAKESILERIFCIEYEENGFDLLMGKISEKTKRNMSRFLAEVSPLPLRIFDDYCHTDEQLYTLIEDLGYKPQVIILDHLQHVQSSGKKTQWETLTEYLRCLKEMCMRHKIAIVCLCQINRDGSEKPSMQHLKGTGAIEEMADQVILMHKPTEPNEDGYNFQILIAKNRFGPTGNFDLYFDAPKFKFLDYPPINNSRIS